MQYVSPNHWYISTRFHDVTSKKVVFFICKEVSMLEIHGEESKPNKYSDIVEI